MVGLFSAWRGDEGGKMGVRDEEEREDGKPGEGVSGVAGLEGGNEDGLELVSSAELSDSLRKWVYLVFGTSSIMNLQSQVSYISTRVHAGSTDSIKVSLSQCSKFLSTRTRGHLSVSLGVRAASICLVVRPPLIARQPKNRRSGRRGAANGRTRVKKVCFWCTSAAHVVVAFHF